MVFSSVTFLFLFLPLVIALYYLTPRSQRNSILLLASLLFYFWGTLELFFIILVSIGTDYLLGRIQIGTKSQRVRQGCVATSLIINLGILAYFKYFNFFIENISHFFLSLGLQPITGIEVALPIGISFYTFQTLSYQIDLYRRDVPVQRSLRDFSLFVSLFPQLIAGPIVRYKKIHKQLTERQESVERFFSGIGRFSCGLGKKVLIADGLAPLVDQVFSTPPQDLSTGVIWLGIFAFFLQIYFDFSGYSDMAIGLGRMFGFELPENFRHPYAARSITAFWQRWHITLTMWFRDYLYRPLSATGQSKFRASLNVYIVFLLCGLWHGANWTFIVFGLYFGTLLVIEHHFWARWGRFLPRLIQHFYMILAVLIGMIFFRSPDISYAFDYIAQGFSFVSVEHHVRVSELLNDELVLLLVLGSVFSLPVVPLLREWATKLKISTEYRPILRPLTNSVMMSLPILGCSLVLLLSFLVTSARVYNPFIYFEF